MDSSISSVLVSVGGYEADQEAVKLGCELLSGNRRYLHIVYIIEVAPKLPVDSEIPSATVRGDAILRDMEAVAKPFVGAKLKLNAELLQARQAGYAIVNEAVEKSVDAIVMPVPRMTEYGEFTLGKTIPYVFEHAPCKVILWRSSHPRTDQSSHAKSYRRIWSL